MAKRKLVKTAVTEQNEGPSASNSSLNGKKAKQATPRKKRKIEVIEDEFIEDINIAKRLAEIGSEVDAALDEKDKEKEKNSAKSKKKGSKKEVKAESESEAEAEVDGKVEKKVKKKRKTKEEKQAEAMPLAARTVGHKLFIGAHVSAAGGRSTIKSIYSYISTNRSQAFTTLQ